MEEHTHLLYSAVYIKTLPLDILVSNWMILLETVTTCPVRDPGF